MKISCMCTFKILGNQSFRCLFIDINDLTHSGHKGPAGRPCVLFLLVFHALVLEAFITFI